MKVVVKIQLIPHVIFELISHFSWHICYWQKQQIKLQIFRLATARIKIYQIPRVIFETKNLFQTLRHPSVSWDITFLYFLI